MCCQYCGKELGRFRTAKAFYCDARCRAAQHRFLARLEQLPPSIAAFYHQLCEYAPAEARTYRLVGVRDSQIWIYPRTDGKEWRAFAGRTHRTAFHLRPFEIPSIDLPGLYGIQFFDGKTPLHAPVELLSGLPLDPVLQHPSQGLRLR